MPDASKTTLSTFSIQFYLRSQFNFFKGKPGNVSEKNADCFYQSILGMHYRYHGGWNKLMMKHYIACWGKMRELIGSINPLQCIFKRVTEVKGWFVSSLLLFVVVVFSDAYASFQIYSEFNWNASRVNMCNPIFCWKSLYKCKTETRFERRKLYSTESNKI